jgi:3-methyladenine DNA glycosylase Tag
VVEEVQVGMVMVNFLIFIQHKVVVQVVEDKDIQALLEEIKVVIHHQKVLAVVVILMVLLKLQVVVEVLLTLVHNLEVQDMVEKEHQIQ